MNDSTGRISPCGTATAPRPRSDAAPATIIILVVLSSLYLTTLGMTAVTVGSLVTTTAGAAGYLVRRLRESAAC